ncbi:FAD:protein FMN transferase [Blastopirellula marina]|uniref:FAD:protein FMN transferase n=1 Tax=Blastopirellula marina TaxID=124 RepID=A0A2S8G1J4_9BACT|nr:FAD:protein FMN transferase [Blastopirellula marina]PQO38004.1 FAD:protein FMN transferase [Blastopirellula marina]PTL44660.1 FAD:protein FMN transferase [Blastopirellula marina]
MVIRTLAYTTLWGTFLVSLSMMTTTASAEEASLRAVSQLHMGTMVRIVADEQDAEKFQKATEAAFQRIREIEQICSDYRNDSEVLILSAKSPTSGPVSVSDDLWYVLAEAQRINHLSDGAFDVTVGPLTKEWRRFRRRNQLDEARIEAVRAAIGAKHLQLHPETQAVSLAVPNMRIDLGGIAKGYAIDAALKVLSEHGITRALVDAGGDVGVSGAPRGEPGWKVGIAGLNPKAPPILITHITHSAVATSGDAYQFLEHQGKRYSHILDPRTGYGVAHRGTVTVFAEDATQADAWASALSVLGPSQAAKVLADQGKVATWMEVLVEEEPTTWTSPNLGSWLHQHHADEPQPAP